jgi:TRAP-type C4-dicarboxylate transport system permease small subunit
VPETSGGRAGGAPPGPAGGPDRLFPGRPGHWTGRLLGSVAATVLFAMMALTFLDVVGRKLLSRPVPGAYELTEFLMGTLIFSALPLVTAREGHVTIDVLDHLVPGPVARWQRVAASAVSAGCLAFIAWRLWVLSAGHFRTSEVTMTLHIPHGPFSRLFAVLSALAAVAGLAVLWGHVRGTRPVRPASPAAGS